MLLSALLILHACVAPVFAAPTSLNVNNCFGGTNCAGAFVASLTEQRVAVNGCPIYPARSVSWNEQLASHASSGLLNRSALGACEFIPIPTLPPGTFAFEHSGSDISTTVADPDYSSYFTNLLLELSTKYKPFPPTGCAALTVASDRARCFLYAALFLDKPVAFGCATCSLPGSTPSTHRVGSICAVAHPGDADPFTPCDPTCVVGPYTSWSGCNATCGPGTVTRSRSVSHPSNPAAVSLICPPTVDTRRCEVPPDDCPCQYAPPTVGACNASCDGHATVTEKVLKQAGAASPLQCDGDRVTYRPCGAACRPTPCVLNVWTPWSPPSCPQCGIGIARVRTRTIKTPAVGGGSCDPLRETDRCPDVPCDCQWSNYEKSGGCNGVCSGLGGVAKGKQNMTRFVLREGGPGGLPCVDADGLRVDDCEVDCSGPVACTFGPWVAVTECTVLCTNSTEPALGTREEVRYISTPVQNGGHCPTGHDKRNYTCLARNRCPQDCVLGDWEDWSSCTAQCTASGEPTNGTRTRYRRVIEPPAGGGAACDSLEETELCHNSTRCAVDCALGEWGDPQPCNATCSHDGMPSRGWIVQKREVITDGQWGGRACDQSELVDAVECTTETRCPVNCVWSEWTVSPVGGGCNASCSLDGSPTHGFAAEERHVATAGADGGVACDGSTATRLAACVSERLCTHTTTSTPTASRTPPVFTFTHTPSRTPTPPVVTASQSRTYTPSCSRSASHTRPPSATATATATRPRSPTPTRTVSNTRTSTRARSPSVSATATATPTPSRTATRTGSVSSTRSATRERTRSGSTTLSVTMSRTRQPTHTVTRTPRPSETRSRSVSSTPTPTATSSTTRTSSRTASRTATRSRSREPSQSATTSRSLSLSRTPTRSPTVTATRSRSATDTPSRTPARTDTATATASVSKEPTQTRSVTPPYLTPSKSASPSPSPPPTHTSTHSATRPPTHTPTVSHSHTRPPTHTVTKAPTATATPSVTPPEWTLTPTRTPSRTILPPTPTPSQSATATATRAPSRTGTWSLTPTPVGTHTRSRSLSPTRTPSSTASRTATLTRSASVPTVTRTVTLSRSPTPPTRTPVPTNTPPPPIPVAPSPIPAPVPVPRAVQPPPLPIPLVRASSMLPLARAAFVCIADSDVDDSLVYYNGAIGNPASIVPPSVVPAMSAEPAAFTDAPRAPPPLPSNVSGPPHDPLAFVDTSVVTSQPRFQNFLSRLIFCGLVLAFAQLLHVISAVVSLLPPRSPDAPPSTCFDLLLPVRRAVSLMHPFAPNVVGRAAYLVGPIAVEAAAPLLIPIGIYATQSNADVALVAAAWAVVLAPIVVFVYVLRWTAWGLPPFVPIPPAAAQGRHWFAQIGKMEGVWHPHASGASVRLMTWYANCRPERWYAGPVLYLTPFVEALILGLPVGCRYAWPVVLVVHVAVIVFILVASPFVLRGEAVTHAACAAIRAIAVIVVLIAAYGGVGGRRRGDGVSYGFESGGLPSILVFVSSVVSIVIPYAFECVAVVNAYVLTGGSWSAVLTRWYRARPPCDPLVRPMPGIPTPLKAPRALRYGDDGLYASEMSLTAAHAARRAASGGAQSAQSAGSPRWRLGGSVDPRGSFGAATAQTVLNDHLYDDDDDEYDGYDGPPAPDGSPYVYIMPPRPQVPAPSTGAAFSYADSARCAHSDRDEAEALDAGLGAGAGGPEIDDPMALANNLAAQRARSSSSSTPPSFYRPPSDYPAPPHGPHHSMFDVSDRDEGEPEWGAASVRSSQSPHSGPRAARPASRTAAIQPAYGGHGLDYLMWDQEY